MTWRLGDKAAGYPGAPARQADRLSRTVIAASSISALQAAFAARRLGVLLVSRMGADDVGLTWA